MHIAGERILFQNVTESAVFINGREISPGDYIEVDLRSDFDTDGEGFGEGGPWGWGGYTTEYLKSIASAVYDAGDGTRLV